MSPPNDQNARTLKKDAAAVGKPAQPDLIGKTLGGRYVVERELGRGGMGAVYLAHDKPELHRRPVVVKVLLESSLKNDWVVAKFEQEIESLTRLDDPGVVGIFDAGRLEDGAPYLVMQYVEGTNLRLALPPHGMELEQAAAIIRQLTRSIGAAHDAGILHRDLKPENIMLRTMPSGERLVKIIDFGIAKIRSSIAGPSPVTGFTVGTIGYMSPEQLSAKPLTPASDIYALGVIAYEMLTGRSPFQPDSVFQLLEMQRAGVQVNAGELRPELTAQTDLVLGKALAFESSERYQSAPEFGEELASVLIAASKREPAKGSVATLPSAEVHKTAEAAFGPTLETAHVLCLDLVGYSKLLIDEQSEQLQKLQQVVRASEEFQKMKRAGQLLLLPTGDGMALSFFSDPESPVRCAVEVSKALRERPDIRLRMGVHSGLVYRIEDINANLNIAGGGINYAQRVMDCGDAGHILLSGRVAEDLQQLSRWATYLHDLGETVVKHGVRVHIYNLYNAEFGNPATPAKLQSSLPRSQPGAFPTRRWLVAALILLLVGASVVAGWFWLTPSRNLSYSLTVQKMRDGQPEGGEIQSTGSELYGNLWKFRVNVVPGQAGSLYLLNEGPINYNVLFPTPANHDSIAQLAGNQTIQTGWLFFDKNPGTEKVWIIWSAKPLNDLETVFREAVHTDLEIREGAQIKTVRDLIGRYGTTEPQVDKDHKLTMIKGRGDVLISLLSLEHNQY